MLEKLTIRSQILGTFAIFSIVVLLTFTLLSIGNMAFIGSNAKMLTKDSLEKQITRNILLTSSENSLVIERKLENAHAAVKALTTATEQLVSVDSSFGYKKSYLDFNESTLPPDIVQVDGYEVNISITTSSYYFPRSYPNNVSSLTSAAMNDTIIRSSHLDQLFRPLYQNNHDFAWFNVGFEEGSILRRFPGATVDPTRNYDLTKETWYIKARDAAKGTITYTDPYFDQLTQSWIISISQSFSDDNGKFIGVVSGDFLLSSIQNQIHNVQFLKSGFASLIRSDGVVIAHPDLAPDSLDNLISISEIEVNSLDGTSALNDHIMIQITSSLQGVTKFTKDGEVYIISHAPILDKFHFLIIILESEAIQVVNQIEKQIEDTQSQITMIMISLSLLTFIVVITVGFWLSFIITEPIDKLSKIAMQLMKNITKRDIFEGIELDESISQNDEIGNLTRSFTRMIQSLRDSEKTKKE